MKYNIRSYARMHSLTVSNLFTKAWKEYFKQNPYESSIQVDVATYLEFGAVPPYVASFMEKRAKNTYKMRSFIPYWATV